MFTPVRAAQQTTLRKNCPYSELFWSAFCPHFPILLRISPYSVRMRENAGKMRTRITPNTACHLLLQTLPHCTSFLERFAENNEEYFAVDQVKTFEGSSNASVDLDIDTFRNKYLISLPAEKTLMTSLHFVLKCLHVSKNRYGLENGCDTLQNIYLLF